MKDSELINFSQDHELDYCLKKLDKRCTQNNRKLLKLIGDEVKKKLDKKILKHVDFFEHAPTIKAFKDLESK